jgi:hypothetical protein
MRVGWEVVVDRTSVGYRKVDESWVGGGGGPDVRGWNKRFRLELSL